MRNAQEIVRDNTFSYKSAGILFEEPLRGLKRKLPEEFHVDADKNYRNLVSECLNDAFSNNAAAKGLMSKKDDVTLALQGLIERSNRLLNPNLAKALSEMRLALDHADIWPMGVKDAHPYSVSDSNSHEGYFSHQRALNIIEAPCHWKGHVVKISNETDTVVGGIPSGASRILTATVSKRTGSVSYKLVTKEDGYSKEGPGGILLPVDTLKEIKLTGHDFNSDMTFSCSLESVDAIKLVIGEMQVVLDQGDQYTRNETRIFVCSGAPSLTARVEHKDDKFKLTWGGHKMYGYNSEAFFKHTHDFFQLNPVDGSAHDIKQRVLSFIEERQGGFDAGTCHELMDEFMVKQLLKIVCSWKVIEDQLSVANSMDGQTITALLYPEFERAVRALVWAYSHKIWDNCCDGSFAELSGFFNQALLELAGNNDSLIDRIQHLFRSSDMVSEYRDGSNGAFQLITKRQNRGEFVQQVLDSCASADQEAKSSQVTLFKAKNNTEEKKVLSVRNGL